MPYKLNNNQSGIKNNYSSYSSYNIFQSPYKNDQKEIITERIYNRDYKNSFYSNKENNPNDNNKISDQQILDFLNRNNDEKENIIKKMKNQKNNFNKTNDERK